MNYIFVLFYKYFLSKYIYFYILLILSGIIGQNNKIYIKKLNKITRIIITKYKYFAQINYYKYIKKIFSIFFILFFPTYSVIYYL